LASQMIVCSPADSMPWRTAQYNHHQWRVAHPVLRSMHCCQCWAQSHLSWPMQHWDV
jgi:hypothetical protein